MGDMPPALMALPLVGLVAAWHPEQDLLVQSPAPVVELPEVVWAPANDADNSDATKHTRNNRQIAHATDVTFCGGFVDIRRFGWIKLRMSECARG